MKQSFSYLVLLLVVGAGGMFGAIVNQELVVRMPDAFIAGNKVLAPGIYVWKLLDSSSNRNIVQITNQKTGRVESTIFALPAFRQDAVEGNELQFWETPKGLPKAVRTWYLPGNNYGQEFAYPARLLATLQPELSLPVATSVKLRPALAPIMRKMPRVLVAAAHAQLPTSAANPPSGSWAVISGDMPRARQGKAFATNRRTIWDALASLPVTATIAPLIGLIGLISMIFFCFTRGGSRRTKRP